MNRRVAMGLLFYPRGGSAQVVRYLAAALPHAGWEASVLCGSLGAPGEESNAATFFPGLDVHALDYAPAVAAAERGEDPLLADPPLHPSYEDRPDAPDRVFGKVDPSLLDRQVAAWTRLFEDAGADDTEVFHLHHLTPQHEAVARRWPDRPVLTHLHGTELKMLDLIARTDPWPHGGFWHETMVGWARRSQRISVISPYDRDGSVRVLGVDPDKVTWIPNGVDVAHFERRDLTTDERVEHWRHWLVEEPRGWAEGGEPGSIRYSDADLEVFRSGGPVLLFVGRFLAFKRVPLLVRAYARARERFPRPAPLVVWGGHPDEWEGDHPHTVAKEAGVDDAVFFVGWRGHDELPLGLSCSDVMVAPSVNEPFGQVFLEAMSCNIPVVTTATGGPLSFVNTKEGAPNGWLVPPDDEAALADALVEAVADDAERAERGANAAGQIRADFSWTVLAERFGALYDELVRR